MNFHQIQIIEMQNANVHTSAPSCSVHSNCSVPIKKVGQAMCEKWGKTGKKGSLDADGRGPSAYHLLVHNVPPPPKGVLHTPLDEEETAALPKAGNTDSARLGQ